MKYYTKEYEEVLKELKTSEDGLTEKEASKRLAENGKNELPKAKQDSIIKLFFDQFKNPIELILVVTVILSFVAKEYIDAIALIVIIMVDVLMGTYQEWKARKDAESLINMIKSMSRVMRDGGFIVKSNGYILTNSHVVSDGQAADVNVLFNDGTNMKGKVLWNDASLDLAVVKVEKTGLVEADLGDSDKVRIGDIAIAIGNPLGLEFQKSVTQGIISGLDRSIETEKSNMTGLIQTDASINPGNSGGPLLNDKGQIIGINTAKASQAEGLGFAIPINTAKPIIEQIIKSGNFEKVTLGIKGIDVKTFETATGTNLEAENGVYVAEVVSNTPAQRAGIQGGDVITKVGDIEITSMSDLNKALYKYSVGDTSKIEINRGGKNITMDVKF